MGFHQRVLTAQDIKDEIQRIRDEMTQTFGPCDDLQAEADQLQDVLDSIDWSDNPVFIAADHFESGAYAEEYADGLGPTTGWPYDHIDWKKAADQLAMDYKQVLIDSQYYYVRG